MNSTSRHVTSVLCDAHTCDTDCPARAYIYCSRQQFPISVPVTYRIRVQPKIFGGELNLAVWRIKIRQYPLQSANTIVHRARDANWWVGSLVSSAAYYWQQQQYIIDTLRKPTRVPSLSEKEIKEANINVIMLPVEGLARSTLQRLHAWRKDVDLEVRSWEWNCRENKHFVVSTWLHHYIHRCAVVDVTKERTLNLSFQIIICVSHVG